jgi:hypothetical protein
MGAVCPTRMAPARLDCIPFYFVAKRCATDTPSYRLPRQESSRRWRLRANYWIFHLLPFLVSSLEFNN